MRGSIWCTSKKKMVLIFNIFYGSLEDQCHIATFITETGIYISPTRRKKKVLMFQKFSDGLEAVAHHYLLSRNKNFPFANKKKETQLI